MAAILAAVSPLLLARQHSGGQEQPANRIASHASASKTSLPGKADIEDHSQGCMESQTKPNASSFAAGTPLPKEGVVGGYYPAMSRMKSRRISLKAAGVIEAADLKLEAREGFPDYYIALELLADPDRMLWITDGDSIPSDLQSDKEGDCDCWKLKAFELLNAKAETNQRKASKEREPYLPGLHLAIARRNDLPDNDLDQRPMSDYLVALETGPDGLRREIMREELPAWYGTAICVLDLDLDGLLDIAIPWSWGVSGGGGIAMYTLLPDGHFTHTAVQADPEDESGDPVNCYSLYSGYTAFAIVDLDKDGYWELEGRDRLSYYGGEGSFEYLVIWSYNNRSRRWERNTNQFVPYLTEQVKFYDALEIALRNLETNGDAVVLGGAPYMKYEGQYYRLFDVCDSASVHALTLDWDMSIKPHA